MGKLLLLSCIKAMLTHATNSRCQGFCLHKDVDDELHVILVDSSLAIYTLIVY